MDGLSLTTEAASAIREEAGALIALVFRNPDAESSWRWKHEQNPFGESRVVVARRNGRIIGIRPLMRTGLLYHDQTVRAVQCVDSVVEPKEQGKGIFRRMCMAALSGLEDTLVFNTPNEKSYPAYMKMGWRDVGGLVRFWSPLSIKASFRYILKTCGFQIPGSRADEIISRLLGHRCITGELPEEAAARLIEMKAGNGNNLIRLGNSIESIRWRTRTPDGTRFLYYRYQDRLVIIFYLLTLNGFTCVRLLDVLGDYADPPAIAAGARKFVQAIGKEVDLLSLVCHEKHPFITYSPLIWPVRKHPVHFTVNESRLDRADREVFTDPKNWALMLSAFDYN